MLLCEKYLIYSDSREIEMSDTEFEWGTLFNEKGVNSPCGKCAKVLATGKYMVTLKIGGALYFVCQNPKPSCCKIEWNVPILCETQDEADEKKDCLMSVTNDVSKLNLMQAETFLTNVVKELYYKKVDALQQ